MVFVPEGSRRQAKKPLGDGTPSKRSLLEQHVLGGLKCPLDHQEPLALLREDDVILHLGEGGIPSPPPGEPGIWNKQVFECSDPSSSFVSGIGIARDSWSRSRKTR
jgi:hypothetical protein